MEGKEGEGERYTRTAWASPTGKRRQTSMAFIVVAVVWSGTQWIVANRVGVQTEVNTTMTVVEFAMLKTQR